MSQDNIPHEWLLEFGKEIDVMKNIKKLQNYKKIEAALQQVIKERFAVKKTKASEPSKEVL